jgi:hypothetical protein
MGVSLFHDTAPEGFSTFSHAMASMFRLTGGETWLDCLQQYNPDTGSVNIKENIFVFSYIVIVVWILLQVSVAVLLVRGPQIAMVVNKFLYSYF